MQPQNILISKPTALGDVVLALPMATVLKNINPQHKIFFLGREYTRELIDFYQDIDQFLNWDTLKKLPLEESMEQIRQLTLDAWIHITPDPQIMKIAKLAQVPIRIGSFRRLCAWWYCNRWIPVSRKNSYLHESQLDHQFLTPLGGKSIYSQQEIAQNYYFKTLPILPKEIDAALDRKRFRLILHPKSHGQLKGYAWDWPLNHFKQLIQQLSDAHYQIIVTGSAEEGKMLQDAGFFDNKQLLNLCGRLSVGQLMRCIQSSNGLVAGSTGPLHLAAALGVHTLGLFSPRRPFNSLRWGPIGKCAEALEPAQDCLPLHSAAACHCIELISPEIVAKRVKQWYQMTQIGG